MTEFKTKLQKLRHAKGWTQEKLAEEVGVSTKTVSNWENGNAKIKNDNLERLATALEVAVIDIWYGKDSNIDAETKDVLDQTVLTLLEDRSFLSLDMGSFAIAVSIVSLAIALLAMLPHTPVVSIFCFLFATFGIYFGIHCFVIVKKKRKTSPYK